ncbi:MAG: oxidoreductase [SAR86 cluster bacterium]|uniref:Oxidoreductase n=1 Tax=SAR86 cluster bacterium TaxID=2030880 RepID=A0A2A5CIU6_9GAMM|nr:oxidoreductase [Gammaproteobacteria bacterium AH-315-E17]PCJ43712.1 MAG: oxidoreductase [SAR86 cluster bacterium]
MKARRLWFIEPKVIEIREHELSPLASDEVLVRTVASGISAGTEMLVYRGQLPQDVPLDASIKAFQGLDGSYPLPYGYACVGVIEALGSALNKAIKTKKVFAFQPHASHFICKLDQLIFLPDGMSDETGTFLANMETAVNFLIDGAAQKHENVAIIGVGIVGQLLNSLLNQYPLNKITVIDTIKARRDLAAQEKLTFSFTPDAREVIAVDIDEKFDLIFELSGNPEVLNLAIELSGFAGRIIVGSWYGNKSASINLGGAFHRNRLKIISSQVSTISPEHALEWTKAKRLKKALALLTELDAEKYITHRFPLSQADKAYQLLDREPDKTLQIILTYED